MSDVIRILSLGSGGGTLCARARSGLAEDERRYRPALGCPGTLGEGRRCRDHHDRPRGPAFGRWRAELGKRACPGSRQRKCRQRDAALPDHECPMIRAEGSDGGMMMRRYVASSAWLGRVVILFLSLKRHLEKLLPRLAFLRHFSHLKPLAF